MHRQKIDKPKYLTVLAITVLVFLIGILIGNYFAGIKITKLTDLGTKLKTDTVAMELKFDLLKEDPCGAVNSTKINDELYELATKLDYMENRLGEDDSNVIQLKEYYMLLELRNWMFMEKTNKECGLNRTLILYFYSNKKDCKTCEEQGFILTWLRKNYPNVYIYSFDINIDDAALSTIKNIFYIDSTPAIVINRKTYSKFMTKAELEDLI